MVIRRQFECISIWGFFIAVYFSFGIIPWGSEAIAAAVEYKIPVIRDSDRYRTKEKTSDKNRKEVNQESGQSQFQDQYIQSKDQPQLRQVNKDHQSVSPHSQDAIPTNESEDTIWSLYNQLQVLQQEMQQLRGLLEIQEHELATIKKNQRKRYLDLDQRLQAVNLKLFQKDSPEVQAANQTATGVFSASESDSNIQDRNSLEVQSRNDLLNSQASAEEEERYQYAQKLIGNRRFTEATQVLSKLIKDFPNGSYTAHAHYWLGELAWAMQPSNDQLAEYHFQFLLNNHPKHVKVPAALYKMAVLKNTQGDAETAKSYLHQLIENYPSDASVDLAKKYLAEIQATQ